MIYINTEHIVYKNKLDKARYVALVGGCSCNFLLYQNSKMAIIGQGIANQLQIPRIYQPLFCPIMLKEEYMQTAANMDVLLSYSTDSDYEPARSYLTAKVY
jgi:hypothetical protein